jgi:hypothetical protein
MFLEPRRLFLILICTDSYILLVPMEDNFSPSPLHLVSVGSVVSSVFLYAMLILDGRQKLHVMSLNA